MQVGRRRMVSRSRGSLWCWLVVGAMLAAVAPANARPLDDVVASKTLRVIAYDDNEPFSWTDKGEPRGIDVDVARAVADKLNVAAEIVLRMQAEKLDMDLRFNIVRGPLTGGVIGDVMMHVPVDQEYARTVKGVVVGNGYFEQRVALAVDRAREGEIASFDVFKGEKVAVQLGTVADYFLMRFDNGALVNNVTHYLRPTQAADKILKKDATAVFGVQSSLEALFNERGVQVRWSNPPTPGLVRGKWVLGIAVDERSRDLSYAIGDILKGLAADGTLKLIYAKYGVTYLPPSEP
jgi:polar amino acid transport system substrate-binding protein